MRAVLSCEGWLPMSPSGRGLLCAESWGGGGEHDMVNHFKVRKGSRFSLSSSVFLLLSSRKWSWNFVGVKALHS